jgi:hypothetical protein
LGNDHLTREPLRHVEGAGLIVERLERSKWGIVERLAARKPAGWQPDIRRRDPVGPASGGRESRDRSAVAAVLDCAGATKRRGATKMRNT